MDVLIRAFKQAFPQRDEPVALTIAGDGPERAALQTLAADDPRIRLLGYVEDVGPLYSNAHVCVSAARIEPFGLTILEAMQAGCHLVCTRTKGPLEFLADQPPHWVAIDDVDELARAMQARAATSSQARAWDMSAFGPAHAASRVEEFYRACINDRAQK